MTDDSWPSPPREPGPWGGGPPVAPEGGPSIPPLRPGSAGPADPSPGLPPIAGPQSAPIGAAPWSPAQPGQPSPAGQGVYPGGPTQYVGPPPGQVYVDRAPRWVIAVAAFVVVGLIAGAVYLVTQKDSPYPDNWDPRVAAIAEWVETARGLDFKNPVHVLFLTPEEYSGESTGEVSSDAELTAEDKETTTDAVAMLRALGLVEGDVDLTAASNTLADSGTLAFYSPSTETVYVRGTEVTPALEVTLAHELVHVLQDQHFDLERIGELESSGATTLRALAEGDAGRIEADYVAQVLTDEDRAEYQFESMQTYEESAGSLDESVPPALSAFFASPYIFGPKLVDYLFASGKTAAIDAALKRPPSEFALFDPVSYDPTKNLAADQRELVVAVPDGAETIDSGTFGPTTWYFMLAARMDPRMALEATDGITADGYVQYRQADGLVCVAATAEGSTGDLAELSSALEGWVAKSPEGSAEVSSDDAQVDFRSCDPGKEATGAGEVSMEILYVAAIRTEVYVEWIKQGFEKEPAACFARAVIDEFSLEEIGDPDFGTDADKVGRMESLAASCR